MEKIEYFHSDSIPDDEQYQKILNCFSDSDVEPMKIECINICPDEKRKKSKLPKVATIQIKEEEPYSNINALSSDEYIENGVEMLLSLGKYAAPEFTREDIDPITVEVKTTEEKSVQKPQEMAFLVVESTPSTNILKPKKKRGRRAKLDSTLRAIKQSNMMLDTETYSFFSKENKKEETEENRKAMEERLTKEHERLKLKLSELKKKVDEANAIKNYENERITFGKLKDNSDMLNYYTGIKSFYHIDIIIKDIQSHNNLQKQPHLDVIKVEEQTLLTLMKLWRNFVIDDLAFRFRITVTQAKEIIHSLIIMLHDIYYKRLSCYSGFSLADEILDKIHENAIQDSSSNSSNSRIIIDAITVYCSSKTIDSNDDEPIKEENKVPFKNFVAITPQKEIIFSSNLFHESLDSFDILQDYGILDQVTAGKMILSEHCLIHSEVILKSIEDRALKVDKRIKAINSKIRLHIGKVTIWHIRKYAILNHIPLFLSKIASHVSQLCAALVHLQSTLNVGESKGT